MQLTKEMLDHLKAVHAKKRLHLSTSRGMAGTIDIDGDRELPVSLLIDESLRSLERAERIATLESLLASQKRPRQKRKQRT